MLINILYLAQRRKHFSDLIFYLLTKCNYKDFNITICGVENIDEGETVNLVKKAQELGLNASALITKYGSTNYIDKIIAATNLTYKYTIKMDEDIFLGPQAWDYFLNNINILDDEDNILLAPTLSTGIPTCDNFIEYNLNDFEKKEILDIFGKTNVGDYWGANYSTIRDELKNNGYTRSGYYSAVKNIPHFYKGIHPIRINVDAIKYINNKIEININKFIEQRDFFIEEIKEPYMCNSFFAVKTSHWKKIIDDKTLAQDNFDEVTINNYRNNTGKKFLTIPNSFGIHTLYNTLHCEMGLPLEKMNKIENEFVDSITQKIKQLI